MIDPQLLLTVDFCKVLVAYKICVGESINGKSDFFNLLGKTHMYRFIYYEMLHVLDSRAIIVLHSITLAPIVSIEIHDIFRKLGIIYPGSDLLTVRP